MVVEAKKGKPNVPINQRGDYMQKQRMQDQMAQMKPEAGGYPLFNLYVQTPRANMWCVASSFLSFSVSSFSFSRTTKGVSQVCQ